MASRMPILNSSSHDAENNDKNDDEEGHGSTDSDLDTELDNLRSERRRGVQWRFCGSVVVALVVVVSTSYLIAPHDGEGANMGPRHKFKRSSGESNGISPSEGSYSDDFSAESEPRPFRDGLDNTVWEHLEEDLAPLTPEQERLGDVNSVMSPADPEYQDATQYNDATDYDRPFDINEFLRKNTPQSDSDAPLDERIVATTTTTSPPPPGTPACPARRPIPPVPKGATDYNGISWPELCFTGNEEEHVFLMGDWGGIMDWHGNIKPAPNHKGKRGFVHGIDDRAQVLVAEQFNKMAAESKPRYVLNAGDNFYWCGLGCTGQRPKQYCGQDMNKSVESFHYPTNGNTRQFYHIFENLYKGPGVDGVPWLSCLGNHDYGGYQFNLAWDQQIAYTWAPQGRWTMPGQYYHQQVQYPTKGFNVDIYVVDTNNQDTTYIHADPMHNICSSAHNHGASCAPFGPPSVQECPAYFAKLWNSQLEWLDSMLSKSTAQWQIIVTHFPPETWTHYGKNVEDWARLGDKYGIDLIVAAHRHRQELRSYNDPMVKFRSHIPFVVSGGGGGVTSEGYPSNGEHGSGTEQYGFFDMTVGKDKLKIQGYSHTGSKTRYMEVIPKPFQCSVTDGSGPSSFYPCNCGLASNGVPNICADNGGEYGAQWCSPRGPHWRRSLWCAEAPTPAPTEMPTTSPTPVPTVSPTPPTAAPTTLPTPPPTEAPSPVCDTVSDCGANRCTEERENCYEHVTWAMEHGAKQNPEVYGECTTQNSFECFQMFMFRDDHTRCPPPC